MMHDTIDLLAILALRRWADDRAVLRSARTTNYKTTGWQQRSNRNAMSALCVLSISACPQQDDE